MVLDRIVVFLLNINLFLNFYFSLLHHVKEFRLLSFFENYVSMCIYTDFAEVFDWIDVFVLKDGDLSKKLFIWLRLCLLKLIKTVDEVFSFET